MGQLGFLFVCFASHLGAPEYTIGIHKETAKSPESFQLKKVCFLDIPFFQLLNGEPALNENGYQSAMFIIVRQCSCLETASEEACCFLI